MLGGYSYKNILQEKLSIHTHSVISYIVHVLYKTFKNKFLKTKQPSVLTIQDHWASAGKNYIRIFTELWFSNFYVFSSLSEKAGFSRVLGDS